MKIVMIIIWVESYSEEISQFLKILNKLKIIIPNCFEIIGIIINKRQMEYKTSQRIKGYNSIIMKYF